MDIAGSRFLAARINAGVGIGMTIELVSDGKQDSRLLPGDRGVVRGLQQDGTLTVRWDRGFTAEIHPSLATYRLLRTGARATPG